MQYIYALFISIFTLSSYPLFAEADPLCQFKTAIELCHSGPESPETGFIAAKSAIETYKNDKETILLLKESMCLLQVSGDYRDEITKIAEDVIKESSNTFFIGAAWLQKGRMAFYEGDHKKAINYFDIALNTLKRAEDTAAEGNISYKKIFECLCHIKKRDSYDELNDKKRYEAEVEILKTYDWIMEK